MNTPVGMSIRTPNTVTQEGGIASGSFSIQSMNTTAINQMYQNTANIWGSLTEFGNEMFDLAYKYTMYKAKQKAARGGQEDEAALKAASDPQTKADHDKQTVIDEQTSSKRESTGSGSLGSHQSTLDKQEGDGKIVKQPQETPKIKEKTVDETVEEITGGPEELTGPPANLAEKQTVQVVDEEMKRLLEEEEDDYNQRYDMPRGVH